MVNKLGYESLFTPPLIYLKNIRIALWDAAGFNLACLEGTGASLQTECNNKGYMQKQRSIFGSSSRMWYDPSSFSHNWTEEGWQVGKPAFPGASPAQPLLTAASVHKSCAWTARTGSVSGWCPSGTDSDVILGNLLSEIALNAKGPLHRFEITYTIIGFLSFALQSKRTGQKRHI